MERIKCSYLSLNMKDHVFFFFYWWLIDTFSINFNIHSLQFYRKNNNFLSYSVNVATEQRTLDRCVVSRMKKKVDKFFLSQWTEKRVILHQFIPKLGVWRKYMLFIDPLILLISLHWPLRSRQTFSFPSNSSASCNTWPYPIKRFLPFRWCVIVPFM